MHVARRVEKRAFECVCLSHNQYTCRQHMIYVHYFVEYCLIDLQVDRVALVSDCADVHADLKLHVYCTLPARP